MAKAERRKRWSAAAKRDLREIWNYYTLLASRDVANRLLREIEAASEQAAEQPLLRRPRDDIAPGLRAVLVPPYILFYRLSDNSVEIVRVLHQKRNLPAELRKGEP